MDIDYVCFAVGGTDEIIKEEVNNLQLMLGKKYEVKITTVEKYDTRLMSIKKISNER